jgi:hypothetical protein
MSFGFSPDGKRIYAFCIGQDILVLNSEDGHRLGTIPLAHRNITGVRATYGLRFSPITRSRITYSASQSSSKIR